MPMKNLELFFFFLLSCRSGFFLLILPFRKICQINSFSSSSPPVCFMNHELINQMHVEGVCVCVRVKKQSWECWRNRYGNDEND